MTRGGSREADTLGRKVVLRGQMAGGEKLLEGAVREGKLALPILLTLSDQQARRKRPANYRLDPRV